MIKQLLTQYLIRSQHSFYINKRNFFNKLSAATAKASDMEGRSPFDYYLVLDFEATCERGTQIDQQEIIEFPVLKVNGKTFKTESKFHRYVRPVFNPQLTPFCTELTGIIQQQVDEQQDFKDTLKVFNEWMRQEGLLREDTSSIFVTCGDWDLKTMLRHQCQLSGLEIPSYFNRWLNIKKIFCDLTGIFPKGLPGMLTFLKLKHTGRLHSGIDDCSNITEIMKELHRRGCHLKSTSSMADAGSFIQ